MAFDGMQIMMAKMIGLTPEQMQEGFATAQNAMQMVVRALAQIESNSAETLRLTKLLCEKEGIQYDLSPVPEARADGAASVPALAGGSGDPARFGGSTATG